MSVNTKFDYLKKGNDLQDDPPHGCVAAPEDRDVYSQAGHQKAGFRQYTQNVIC